MIGSLQFLIGTFEDGSQKEVVRTCRSSETLVKVAHGAEDDDRDAEISTSVVSRLWHATKKDMALTGSEQREHRGR